MIIIVIIIIIIIIVNKLQAQQCLTRYQSVYT